MEEKIIKGLNLCIRSIAFRLINMTSGFKGEKWRILEEELILNASQDCIFDFRKSLEKIIEYSKSNYEELVPTSIIARLTAISKEIKSFNDIDEKFIFKSNSKFVTQEMLADTEKFNIFYHLRIIDDHLRSFC